jgi:hypothetical protein
MAQPFGGIDGPLDDILLVLPASTPRATTEVTEVTGESTGEGLPGPDGGAPMKNPFSFLHVPNRRDGILWCGFLGQKKIGLA